jgi:hypothetical protein
MLLKFIIILSLVFTFSLSHAGNGSFTVKFVGISATSNTIFFDVNESHTYSECTDKNSFRFETSHPLYKEVYATLLTALATQMTVNLAFTDSSSECLYNAPKILSVYIK